MGMGVPLIAESFIDPATNKQKLTIWTNGKEQIVEPPFKPYCLSKVPLPILAGAEFSVEKLIGYPLSSLKQTEMYKYSFVNTGSIAALNRTLEQDANKKFKPMMCDNHTEFRERIIIDLPEYFKGFPNTNDLKVFGFDIETLRYMNRNFPGICSMAWGTSVDRVVSKQANILWNEKGEPYVTKEEETAIINAFMKDLIAADPDIVIGYNHKDFDFPELFARCDALGIDYKKLARGKGTVVLGKKKVEFKELKDPKITGRVVYDIMFAARADQSLNGVKKGLKDVCEHMKIPIIREDTDNTATVPLDKMKLYNESDVILTFKLFKVYFLNQQTLCEMFGIPLNMMLDGSPSFLANIFHAPDLHKLGIYSDGMNKERYPAIYDLVARAKAQATEAEAAEDEEDDDDDEDDGKKKKKDSIYQAAHVAIYLRGFFEKVFKVDYKGMYNAIEITGNFSPETCMIVDYLPYNKHGFKAKRQGNFIIYIIPDNKIKKNVVIAVNHAFDGVLRKKLKEIRETRFKIKQLMKTCAPEDKPKLESQQYGLKVVANIPSGYNGLSSARWGSIPVSILTVGVGRLLIIDTIKYLEAKYGGNEWMLDEKVDIHKIPKNKFKVCIEVDTDGIYTCKEIDIDDLNKYVEKRVKELLLVEENEMQLDFEKFHEGYFVGMKTYVLFDEDDELTIHGGALKGTRQAKCFDIALQKLIRCVLKGEGKPKDVINDILDINKYTLPELSFSVTLSKDPETYDSTSQYAKLINKAKALGMNPKAGSEFTYVTTRGKDYEFLHMVKTTKEIDVPYYEKMISKLIIDFGLGDELLSKDTDDVNEHLDTSCQTDTSDMEW